MQYGLQKKWTCVFLFPDPTCVFLFPDPSTLNPIKNTCMYSYSVYEMYEWYFISWVVLWRSEVHIWFLFYEMCKFANLRDQRLPFIFQNFRPWLIQGLKIFNEKLPSRIRSLDYHSTYTPHTLLHYHNRENLKKNFTLLVSLYSQYLDSKVCIRSDLCVATKYSLCTSPFKFKHW